MDIPSARHAPLAFSSDGTASLPMDTRPIGWPNVEYGVQAAFGVRKRQQAGSHPMTPLSES
jgi:hypothetical protein